MIIAGIIFLNEEASVLITTYSAARRYITTAALYTDEKAENCILSYAYDNKLQTALICQISRCHAPTKKC